MRKKNNKTTVQTEQYTPYDVSGKISSDAFEVLGADAKSMESLKMYRTENMSATVFTVM